MVQLTKLQDPWIEAVEVLLSFVRFDPLGDIFVEHVGVLNRNLCARQSCIQAVGTTLKSDIKANCAFQGFDVLEIPDSALILQLQRANFC